LQPLVVCLERACGRLGDSRSRFERFCGVRRLEVCEDGQWLAELATLQCEINRKGKQPRAALPFRDRHCFEIFVAGISGHAHWAFQELA
jgi:hypothetical protein